MANHTHSHAAVYQVTQDDLKADIKRADRELAPYLSKAPSKLFCFCVDCQGDTPEEASELANFVADLGYQQLPAASMFFEWRWEMAYLGALSSGEGPVPKVPPLSRVSRGVIRLKYGSC